MNMSLGRQFNSLLLISQILAIVMVALCLVWTLKSFGGLAWDGSAYQFNVHPLCMVCGFVLFYGEATLAFRVFHDLTKSYAKVVHGGLHIIAFIAAVIGLRAVFGVHNSSGIANMYSLHSWCGLSTVLLFSIQYVFGFLSYFWPGMPLSIRQSYMPVHKYFGLGTFFLAAVSTISGIDENLVLKTGASYAQLPPTALIGNCLGLFVLAYVVVVGYLVHNPEWKRTDDVVESESRTSYTRISHGGTDK